MGSNLQPSVNSPDEQYNPSPTVTPWYSLGCNWKAVGLNPSKRRLTNHYATARPKHNDRVVIKSLCAGLKRVAAV